MPAVRQTPQSEAELTREVFGACPLDCPDACSWVVTVENGVPIKLRGRKDHPFTRGGLCVKVNPYLDYVASDDRLLSPLKRVGPKGQGRFVAISWDEALSEIAARLQGAIDDHGAESIWPFAGTGSMGYLQGWPGAGQRLWNHLGTTRHDAPPICSLTGHLGMSYTAGDAYGMNPVDLADSGLVLLWGTNTVSTNQHLWPFIKRAQKSGAPIVVVDPTRTRTAERADLHIAPMPGTDAPLAFGLMHALVERAAHDADFLNERCLGWAEFNDSVLGQWPASRSAEVCGIDVNEIEQLADLVASHRPLGLRFMMGMQRHAGGGQAARALSCIPAVTGDYGKLGGGAVYSTGSAYRLNTDRLNAVELRKGSARSLSMTRLGEGLLDLDEPPVKALIISAANPVVSNPDQNRTIAGLKRDDLFTVVIEHRHTDTVDYADIVLPSTMQTEHVDIHDSYSHVYLHWNNPATAPRGEALPHTEIFRRLAAAMNLEEPALFATDEELAEAVLDSDHPNLAGITADQLRVDGYARLVRPSPDLRFIDGFPTESGLFEFVSARAEREGLNRLPTHTPPRQANSGRSGELSFVAAASHNQLNSTFANTDLHPQKEPCITINPTDADQLGLVDGDQVFVSNERGRFEAQLIVDPSARSGVAISQKGVWAKGGSTINAVTAEADADMGRGATYHDNLVTLSKAWTS